MDSKSYKLISAREIIQGLRQGEPRMLARAISLVENETAGYESMLEQITEIPQSRIIGITGPPGAGKSTITNRITGELLREGKKVGILCVDPSSPFHRGALLGDRVRMYDWYNHPGVFIRSLASRGSMGGLSPHIFETADLLRAAGYDEIIIETAGVGQTEVEIASLADTTVVVLVPEAGDEIQTMKSGLMEIADLFAVNKSDRPGAALLVAALESGTRQVPVLKTVAITGEGITELLQAIKAHGLAGNDLNSRSTLMAGRAWQIIMKRKMKTIDRKNLEEKISRLMESGEFNLYRFAASFGE